MPCVPEVLGGKNDTIDAFFFFFNEIVFWTFGTQSIGSFSKKKMLWFFPLISVEKREILLSSCTCVSCTCSTWMEMGVGKIRDPRADEY